MAGLGIAIVVGIAALVAGGWAMSAGAAIPGALALMCVAPLGWLAAAFVAGRLSGQYDVRFERRARSQQHRQRPSGLPAEQPAAPKSDRIESILRTRRKI